MSQKKVKAARKAKATEKGLALANALDELGQASMAVQLAQQKQQEAATKVRKLKAAVQAAASPAKETKCDELPSA